MLVIFNLDAVPIHLLQILLSVLFIMNRHIFHIMLILAVNMLFCVVFFFTVNMVLWLMFFFTVSMIFRLMIVITRMNCSIRMNMRMSMIVRLSIFHALDDLLLHIIVTTRFGPVPSPKESSTCESHCSIVPPLQTNRSAFWIVIMSAGVGSNEWLSMPAGTTIVSRIESPAICRRKS